MKKIILTVDVEEWFQTNDFNFPRNQEEKFESRVEHRTMRLLDIFEESGVLGTFFVLGCIAEAHPGLIREIKKRGHEIACHGRYHELMNQYSPAFFREEIKTAKGTLEDVIGEAVYGFRAPSWSIGRGNLWALEELERQGFLWDSSIQPFATFMSGINGVPFEAFQPVLGDHRLKLIEFPPTVYPLANLRIPFSGGFYMRVMPFGLVHFMIKRCLEKNRQVMIYCHPWEYDEEMPRLACDLSQWLLHYFRIKGNEKKLTSLMKSHEYQTVGEVAERLLREEAEHEGTIGKFVFRTGTYEPHRRNSDGDKSG